MRLIIADDTPDPDGDVTAGGAEEAVTEEVAQDEDVDPGFPKMGGVGVAQTVGREVAAHGFVAVDEADFFGVFFHDAIHLLILDVEDGIIEGAAVSEVVEHARGFFVEQDVAIFVALAGADEDLEFLEVEVGELYRFEF